MKKSFFKYEAYKAMYAKNNPEWYKPVERFPNLTDFSDVASRLCALASLEVERRGHKICFDANTEDKISRIAEWIVRGNQNGLMLCGSLGNGKTTMLRALKGLFPSSKFCRAVDIHSAGKVDGLNVWGAETKILIIDDLGCEPSKSMVYGEEYTPIADILHRRYERNLVTIVSSNLNLEALRDRYGVRVCDRILEQYKIIVFDGPSYRTLKK